MSAKIKLQRRGTIKKPFYRVVVQDEARARVSKVIEILGTYDPMKEPSAFVVDKDKVLAWLKNGAQPTDRVRLLLGKAGIMEPIDLAALNKRQPKAEIKAVPAPAEAPAA